MWKTCQSAGNESLAAELRLRTIIELTAFVDHYVTQYGDLNFEASVGAGYEETIHELAVDGGHASVWALCGLATVVERPIVSVYPSTGNQELTQAVASCLNRRLLPRREYDDLLSAIFIMWTRTCRHCPGTMWTSNHFVPLLEGSALSSTVIHTPSTAPMDDEDEIAIFQTSNQSTMPSFTMPTPTQHMELESTRLQPLASSLSVKNTDR